MRKLTVVLLIIFILLIALGAVIVLRWVQDIPDALLAEAELSAAVSDQGGVDISSAFLLRFPEGVSAASVNRALRVEPEIALGVHQGSSRNEVLLSPAEPLQADTRYTFTISSEEKSYQWSFQTKAALRVVETRPGMQETGVATDAALEFVLDQMLDVDLELLASAVSIYPETAGDFSQNGRVIRFQPAEGWQPATVYTVQVGNIPLLSSDVALAEPCNFSFETAASSASHWYAEGEDAFLSGEKAVFYAWIRDRQLFDRMAALTAAEDVSAEMLTQAEDSALTVQAQLYRFDSAADYADALLAMVWQDPYWGDPFLTRSGNVEKATWLETRMLRLAPLTDGSYRFEWPETLSDGFYLLRVTYLNQPCDLFFSVSALSAWMTADSEQTLLWLHDTSSGSAVDDAQVTDWQASISRRADRSGLVQLDREADATVYLIESAAGTLVLPLTQVAQAEEEDFDTWRYLYTDQTAYQNGDTLYFWGLVQPRDGSALQYERVSVYLYPAAGGDAVWFDYASLSGNTFTGSIALPQLLAGVYSLQVWQSGRLLVAREFTVGEAAATATGTSIENAESQAVLPALLLEPADQYQIGDSFAATFPQESGECLFLEMSGGIISASAGSGNLYLGEFSPPNSLNSYLAAVSFDGKNYRQSAASLLQLDTEAYALQIAITGETAFTAGKEQTVGITVYDAAGMPVANAAVAVQIIAGGSQPVDDPLSAIYGDWQGSGVLEWSSAEDGSGREASDGGGETLCFLTGTTDAAGTLSAEIPALSLADGNGWLLVQAIRDGGTTVQAGVISQRILLRGDTMPDENIAETQPVTYTLESGKVPQESVFSDDGLGSLVILSGEERLYWLSILLETIIAHNDVDTASLPAAAAGEVLLAAMGSSTNLQQFIDSLPDTPLQSADGSAGDLAQSVFVAALDLPTVSAAGLRTYFNSVLQQDNDRLTQIQALTGLAACGDQVLNELKQMLAQPSLQEEELLWLCWGLCLSGDIQPGLKISAAQIEEVASSASSASPAAWQAAAALAAWQGEAETVRQILLPAEGEQTLAAIYAAGLLLPQLQQQRCELTYGSGETMHTIVLPEDGELLFPLAAGDMLCFQREEGAVWYCWLRAWPQSPDSAEIMD